MGKTTWIRDAFDADASLYVDLLDPEVEDRYRSGPSRLESEVRALPPSVEWILIDEVQRAPRLLDVAHRLIESTGKRFVLTGSSGRKLRRGASNLLAEVAAQANGTIVNYANIARDVGADPKTVISYFSILEDTLVSFLLPAFHRSVRKQQSANPKFYYFDTGVKRSLERTLDLPLQPGTYEYGKAFEHFVITQILHLSRYRFPDWRLSYLRTGAGVEIDLVIERPGMPEALIEITSSERIDERDVRGLARFTGDFTSPLALCISRDPTRMRMDGVLCLHWRQALEELGLR